MLLSSSLLLEYCLILYLIRYSSITATDVTLKEIRDVGEMGCSFVLFYCSAVLFYMCGRLYWWDNG